MKKEKKDLLKEQFVELYLEGKTMQEISKLTNYSRNFIGQLLKEDTKIKEYRKRKTVKVSKFKNRCQMNIPISVSFLEKIGISRNFDINEYVDIEVNENTQIITIKKHKI